MSKVYILYFRGLNTYGDDRLHLGPFIRLGGMSRFLEKALGPRRMLPVLDMGPGGPVSMAEKAYAWLNRQPLWNDPETRFHILAHSTGGLAARILYHRPEVCQKILSFVTIATPHRGTPLADGALNLNASTRALLKTAGYDIETRRSFSELTPAAIEKLNLEYPAPSDIPFGSVLAGVPYREMTLISKTISRWGGLAETLSDGFVPVESQRWGRVLHEAYLEHLEELGLSLRGPGRGRARFHKEFVSMIDSLAHFFSSIE